MIDPSEYRAVCPECGLIFFRHEGQTLCDLCAEEEEFTDEDFKELALEGVKE